MRFLMTTIPGEEGNTGAPPSPELMARMGAYVQEGFEKGWLVATGGLDPHATRITSSGGRISVTDGPFTEAKEAVVGFAIIDVAPPSA